jgi:hypothetical protein
VKLLGISSLGVLPFVVYQISPDGVGVLIFTIKEPSYIPPLLKNIGDLQIPEFIIVIKETDIGEFSIPSSTAIALTVVLSNRVNGSE